VVVRHGRTAWNAVGRAQGHADVELDEVGAEQAAAVAPYLAGLRPAALWSSDLTRALQTSAAVEADTGLAVKTDRRLREFDVGLRQGLTIPEFAERYPTEHAAWTRGEEGSRVPGAESHGDVAERIVPALREAMGSLGPGETGVVVTHGAALKVALVGLLGWPPEQATTLRGMDNCAWATLEELHLGGRVRLAGYNESVRPGHDAPQRLPDES
jgi:glucosyl-3-phosphoglycerate phosphatase